MPESKVPSVEVAVCMTESSFIHVTVSLTLTSTGIGLYELLPALATIFTTVELLGMDEVAVAGCCIEFYDFPNHSKGNPDFCFNLCLPILRSLVTCILIIDCGYEQIKGCVSHASKCLRQLSQFGTCTPR